MQDQSPDSTKIGQLLLREGAIDGRQLEQALTIQAQHATYRPLGEILREPGFVSRRTLHDVLFKYRKQIPLGELLVKMGVIFDYQLLQALKAQEHSTKKLGQILVEKGFVTQSYLAYAISMQLGISRIDPGTALGDKALLGKVNTTFLQSKRVIPLRYNKDNHVLTVLMEDPTDKETIMDLEKIFKADVEPVMLRAGTIGDLLNGLLDIAFVPLKGDGQRAGGRERGPTPRTGEQRPAGVGG